MKMRAFTFTLLYCLYLFGVSLGQENPPVQSAIPLDSAFLKTYGETRGFLLGRPVSARITPDGKHVLFLRSGAKSPKRALYQFDLESGQTKELLTAEQVLKDTEEKLTPEEKARRERMRLSAGGFAEYQLSPDGKKILLPLSGKLFLYDRESGKTQELSTGKGTLIDPKFAPKGHKIAYVLNYDLYVYDLETNKETPVTQGGTLVKTNGLAEFVAQEEMGRFSGYWWSPDAQFLAYAQADHHGVEQWFVADSTYPERSPFPQYYPRPGKKNVQVQLGIVSVTGGETKWVEWDRNEYEYLTAVRWDKNGPLTIVLQARNHQKHTLYLIDPQTARRTPLLKETCPPNAFLEVAQDTPIWFSDRQSFFWKQRTPEGIFLTVAQVTPEGAKISATFKELFVKEILASEPQSGQIVISGTSTKEIDTTRNLIAQLKYDAATGFRIEKIWGEETAGQYSASVSIPHDTIVLNTTTPTLLPTNTVFKKGQKIADLPSVAEEPHFHPNVSFLTLEIEKQKFFASVVRPRTFDAKKKYPAIVDVYGGPHHLHVVKAKRNWLIPQWLADQGFIVVAIENRGTPGRDSLWEWAIYQKFADVTLDDQVAGLKALGEKFPELDLSRVGITGWSFGGYMSALAVLKRPDVFHAAVAGAPVTDWEDYDTHYTERYMGLLPESKKAYEKASLLPLAKDLRRPLLLVHGTADDNVYFRHTLRLADALFRSGRDFDMLPLAGLTHMVPDPVVTEKLWTKIHRYFDKNLVAVPPSK
jgi:dipeptidyl-peptidase-4